MIITLGVMFAMSVIVFVTLCTGFMLGVRVGHKFGVKRVVEILLEEGVLKNVPREFLKELGIDDK